MKTLILKGGWLLISLFVLTSCMTPMFEVKSDPVLADVYYQIPSSGERKLIGKTPISMPMSEFRQTVGDSVHSGQYFPIIIEKQGFVTETFQVPVTGFTTLVTQVDVKLKEDQLPREEKTARAVIERLFLAQRFALTQQFERAQIEIDKILADFPKMARAMSMRASIYYAQKNYTESLKWYDLAVQSDPQLEDAVKMSAKIRAIQSGRVPAGEPSSQPPTKLPDRGASP